MKEDIVHRWGQKLNIVYDITNGEFFFRNPRDQSIIRIGGARSGDRNHGNNPNHMHAVKKGPLPTGVYGMHDQGRWKNYPGKGSKLDLMVSISNFYLRCSMQFIFLRTDRPLMFSILFSALLISVQVVFAGSLFAQTTIFPPKDCSSSEMKVIGWVYGEASTFCLSGDDLLTNLNFKNCADGEVLVYRNYDRRPVNAGSPTLNTLGFFCEDIASAISIPTCSAGEHLAYKDVDGTGRFVCEKFDLELKTQTHYKSWAGGSAFTFTCPKGNVISCEAVLSPVGDRTCAMSISGKTCSHSGCSSAAGHAAGMRASLYPSYPLNSFWNVRAVCGWIE